MYFSQIASKLRRKISQFSGVLSKNLDKTCSRFVAECLYGILSSESVLLTEIGRSLPPTVSLKKTEERFCRQLAKESIHSQIHHTIARMAAPSIGRDTLMVLDLSDVTKKYARKMEYIGSVRDASDKVFGKGYWTVNVIATELNHKHITPLYHGLYSPQAPDYVSENVQILNAINHISNHVGTRGIWVMDRGLERSQIIVPLIEKKHQFIIRLIGNRGLLYSGGKASTLEIANKCHCMNTDIVAMIRDGREDRFHISYGYTKVHLPELPNVPLFLVVVKRRQHKPLMLLTTISVSRSPKVLHDVIKSYLKRWDVEETIRYIKQSYDFENVRVLSYIRLKNMAALLLAAIYFTCVILDTAHKLKILTGHILKAAKRIFGIPDFKYYAISDGLSAIFKRCPAPIQINIAKDLPEQGILQFSG